MATTPIVYVICDNNCKFESMTKEQILTAIVQAVNEGTVSDVDAGFVQTVKTINGLPLRFFVGEQSAYDALTDEEKNNLFAIITNDTTKEGLLASVDGLLDDMDGILSGTTTVPKAANATNATSADTALMAVEATKAKNATNATNATNSTNADSVTMSALTLISGECTVPDTGYIGLYVCQVQNRASNLYTIPLFLSDKTADVEAVGAYYDGTYDHGVRYNPTTQKIEPTDENVEIASIFFIKRA